MFRLRTLLIMSLFLMGNLPTIAICAEEKLRDPTQPPTHKNAVTTETLNREIKIDAIIARKNHGVVIIGNHWLKIGDKISGLTIIAIDAHSVKFKNAQDETIVVAMPYSNIKSLITKNGKSSENENNKKPN